MPTPVLKDAALFVTLYGWMPTPALARALLSVPLKLVLIEGAAEPGSLDHIGVEVGSVQTPAQPTRTWSDAGSHARRRSILRPGSRSDDIVASAGGISRFNQRREAFRM